jgi:hypothetical protein
VAADPGSADPVLYMYEQKAGSAKRSYMEEEIKVCVQDARSTALTLDQNGMALGSCPYSLSREDFYTSNDKIQQVHYPEVERFLKKTTGASRVVVFDHNVRNSAVQVAKEGMAENSLPAQSPGGPNIYSPVVFAHNDFTPASATQRVHDLAKDDSTRASSGRLIESHELPTLLGNRFMFVNVWQNISSAPVQKNHLAICDGSSIKLEDFVEIGLLYRERRGVIYQTKHQKEQRWLYFDKLQREEALLLKCFDTKRGVARWTAHQAFDDPSAPPSAPPRESIECRCICFFRPEDPEKTALVPEMTSSRL